MTPEQQQASLPFPSGYWDAITAWVDPERGALVVRFSKAGAVVERVIPTGVVPGFENLTALGATLERAARRELEQRVAEGEGEGDQEKEEGK